eukprot:1483173-Pyramimonas_sp.AAC.1
MRRASVLCQSVRPHAWLVGGSQTSRAEIFTGQFCKSILKDIGNRIAITQRTPLDLLSWTRDRCKHGNMAGTPHARVKGCRFDPNRGPPKAAGPPPAPVAPNAPAPVPK